MALPAQFDVVVVGGGPGGLVSATYLARFRRSVLVVDSGSSRVAKVPRSHNYPGHPDGVVGATLLADLREQVDRYSVDVRPGTVDDIRVDGDGFAVSWADGEARAQAVILATGASDVEPEMLYITDAIREGAVRYCPVCDGFEVIGQAVGVVGDGPGAIGEALYLGDFTDNITLFMEQGPAGINEADRRRLVEAGIAWVSEPIRSLRMWDQQVTVRHGDSETVLDSIYSAFGMTVHSELAVQLGAEVDDAGYLVTDRHQQTTVHGLYAVGDVASGLNQISVATGSAAIAASAIHQALKTGA